MRRSDISIYCTLWELKLPVWVPCVESEKEAEEWAYDESPFAPGRPVRERWIEAWAQGVPGHIGHPDTYPLPEYAEAVVYYDSFLPPAVEDEDSLRAVFIIDEDHREKDGQRYTDPLLVLTGAEYNAATFDDLLSRISDALEERFGATEEAANA